MRISQRQFDRLRIMYAFDLATKRGKTTRLLKALFENGLNPEWANMYDVLGNCRERKRQIIQDIRAARTEFGCFKIRKTKKGYIIYTELARLKA